MTGNLPVGHPKYDVSWLRDLKFTDAQPQRDGQWNGLWNFFLTDKVSIAVATIWRVIDSDGVVVTSYDHGHQFGLPEPVDAAKEALRKLENRPIEKADIQRATGDLHIFVADGVRLEVVTMSSGYESWVLYRDDSLIVASSQGRIQEVESAY